MITALIVEDNLEFRASFKAVLLSFFPTLQVEEAADAVEALKIVHEQCPKLVFADIRLPGENGLELTRKIKEIAPATKVIILTSYDMPEYLEAAAAVGAASFAIKGDLKKEALEALKREITMLLR